MLLQRIPTREQRIRDSGGSVVSPDTPYIKFFTADGSGVADGNLTGNYSGAATYFFYRVPSKSFFRIQSVTIQVADATQFTQTGYGGLGTLTNGVRFFVDVGVVVPLLGGYTIKQNNDFFGLTAHVTLTTFATLPQTLSAEFKLGEDFGGVLSLTENQRIMVLLNDDFSGLTSHRFAARGTLCACPPS